MAPPCNLDQIVKRCLISCSATAHAVDCGSTRALCSAPAISKSWTSSPAAVAFQRCYLEYTWKGSC